MKNLWKVSGAATRKLQKGGYVAKGGWLTGYNMRATNRMGLLIGRGGIVCYAK